MKLRIKAKPRGITVLALPDIAFLLLIFLILTVSVDEQGDIQLPSFRFTQETEFPQTLVITVNETGSVQIGGQEVKKSELSGVLRKIPPSTVIHLMADRRSRYADIDELLGKLQIAGLKDVVLIMEDHALQKD